MKLQSLKNKIKTQCVAFARDESGQGILEYVLIIVAVVGLAALFKDKLLGWFREKSAGVDQSLNQIN